MTEQFEQEIAEILEAAAPTPAMRAGWQERAIKAMTDAHRLGRPSAQRWTTLAAGRRASRTWLLPSVWPVAAAVLVGLLIAGLLLLARASSPRRTSAEKGGAAPSAAQANARQPERTKEARLAPDVPSAPSVEAKAPLVPTAKSTAPVKLSNAGLTTAPPITPQRPAVAAFLAVTAARQPATDATGRALQIGDRLGVGLVMTGKQGRLTLITRRGSEYTLDQNSCLALANGGRSAALRAGRLYCRSREHEFAAIRTSAGKIELLGTVIDAAVKKDRVAVTVVEGRVRLANAHGAAVVGAGRKSLLVASLPPDSGTATNTFAETTWYDSRGQFVSQFGDIAYLVARGDGLLTEVWKMKSDGSEKRRVMTCIYGGGTSWLPGERELLIHTWGVEWGKPNFATRRADTTWSSSSWGWSGRPQTLFGMFSIVGDQTWLLDADSGQDTLLSGLASYEAWDNNAAISPDGTRLAFSGKYQVPGGSAPPVEGVWVYDLRSGDIRKVRDGYSQRTAAWAPDCRRLATGNDHAGLVVVDVDTGEATDLKVRGLSPAFSPDGIRLAYSWRSAQTVGEEPVGHERCDVFVTELAPGRQTHRIGTGAADPPRPLRLLWSPDGTRVAYAESQGRGIVVAQSDGSGAREVYGQQVNPLYIAWTPSGDALYVASGGILVVAGDGSGVKADLGGNGTDSVLTPVEKAQTTAASEAIREAVFQYAVGHVRYYQGQSADAKVAFQASADIFAGLMWRYPQAALSPNQVLLHADKAAAMADGRLKPDEQTGWEIMDDPASRCMRNLHQLVYGLLLCSEDFHGVLFPPQLGSPAAFQDALRPWVGETSVFINPITNRPYRANTNLAGKKIDAFLDRSAVVAFYEERPWPDGTRGVAFLDGRVKRVARTEWEALTKSWGVP